MNDRSAPNGIPIAYLADHQQHIPIVAEWHHREWAYLAPSVTLEDRRLRLVANAQKGVIPTTFVAIAGMAPIGCASLVTSDMSIRGELSPWLASVFVLPSYRNMGVGSHLVTRAMQEARDLGESSLYLYTPDRQAFYARIGWSELEICEYRGFSMTIMQVDLRNGHIPVLPR